MNFKVNNNSHVQSKDLPPPARLPTAHTFIDTVLLQADNFNTADDLIPRAENCAQHFTAWRTWKPLWSTLQATRPSCPHCSPLGHLSVTYISDSGSTPEGLSDHADGRPSSSDFDYMYELGNPTWLNDGAPARFDDVKDAVTTTPPTLAIVYRPNSTAATLFQVRTPKCQHAAPLEFHPETVRQMMHDVQRVRHPNAEVTVSGPATNTLRPHEQHGGVDHVPCLRLPAWPSDEFEHRRRQIQWPPPAARDAIVAFGVHVVPTGFNGAPTELHDWRASFSRAEVITAWHLSPVQRRAIKALKRCRKVLQRAGDCALKSFFIKTAMFWLCQDAPSAHCGSVTEVALMILGFLERAVERCKLEDFFWADVNQFGYRQTEMPDIMQMILRLRMNMNDILMADCREMTSSIGNVLMPLTAHPCPLDSEALMRIREGQVRGIERPSGTRWEYGRAVKNGAEGCMWRQDLEMQLEYDLELLLARELGIERTAAEEWAQEWRRSIAQEQGCDDVQSGWVVDKWDLNKFA